MKPKQELEVKEFNYADFIEAQVSYGECPDHESRTLMIEFKVPNGLVGVNIRLSDEEFERFKKIFDDVKQKRLGNQR